MRPLFAPLALLCLHSPAYTETPNTLYNSCNGG